ncbi:uncharacterized protein METZ01_LOCUS280448 [marine metagenome]|uniref:Uncharacterized protein n=1 Tax=marine metagenome TaxID=408172 RepID=A0A382KS15_9ZZZZ
MPLDNLSLASISLLMKEVTQITDGTRTLMSTGSGQPYSITGSRDEQVLTHHSIRLNGP